MEGRGARIKELMPAKPTHIIDASALIAYFNGEDGHDRFAQLLSDEQNVLAMHATNLCEVYYGYLRADGLERAEKAWEEAIRVVQILKELDDGFVKRVARWKVEYGLDLADAHAAAAAEEHACELVTTDSDFDAANGAGALRVLKLRDAPCNRVSLEECDTLGAESGRE